MGTHLLAGVDLGSIDKTRFGCMVGSAFGGMQTYEEQVVFLASPPGLPSVPSTHRGLLVYIQGYEPRALIGSYLGLYPGTARVIGEGPSGEMRVCQACSRVWMHACPAACLRVHTGYESYCLFGGYEPCCLLGGYEPY